MQNVWRNHDPKWCKSRCNQRRKKMIQAALKSLTRMQKRRPATVRPFPCKLDSQLWIILHTRCPSGIGKVVTRPLWISSGSGLCQDGLNVSLVWLHCLCMAEHSENSSAPKQMGYLIPLTFYFDEDSERATLLTSIVNCEELVACIRGHWLLNLEAEKQWWVGREIQESEEVQFAATVYFFFLKSNRTC